MSVLITACVILLLVLLQIGFFQSSADGKSMPSPSLSSSSRSTPNRFVIPVVYIHFGNNLPNYLKVNIELASIRNPVIILHSDLNFSRKNDFDPEMVTADLITSYNATAGAFTKLYKHLSKDNSKGRYLHELQCIQRWFVLQEYMRINRLDTVFFGDGDSSVFANITAVHSMRKVGEDQKSSGNLPCDAVINVDFQGSTLRWAAAGEASIWNYKSIKSFCNFALAMYQKTNVPILEEKLAISGTSVVDMSILWLFWVANHKKVASEGFAAGRPYYPVCKYFKTQQGILRNHSSVNMLQMRVSHDKAFDYAKALSLPKLDPPVTVCNGMDVINRTAFDHMHGWKHGNLGSFTFNLDSKLGSFAGVPSITEVALFGGGKPESMRNKDIELLKDEKIYLNNLHYQGDSKNFLEFDVCRVLKFMENRLSGARKIASQSVEAICTSVFSTKKRVMNAWPCQSRAACGQTICV